MASITYERIFNDGFGWETEEIDVYCECGSDDLIITEYESDFVDGTEYKTIKYICADCGKDGVVETPIYD